MKAHVNQSRFWRDMGCRLQRRHQAVEASTFLSQKSPVYQIYSKTTPKWPKKSLPARPH
jgi:hypothetical protein